MGYCLKVLAGGCGPEDTREEAPFTAPSAGPWEPHDRCRTIKLTSRGLMPGGMPPGGLMIGPGPNGTPHPQRQTRNTTPPTTHPPTKPPPPTQTTTHPPPHHTTTNTTQPPHPPPPPPPHPPHHHNTTTTRGGRVGGEGGVGWWGGGGGRHDRTAGRARDPKSRWRSYHSCAACSLRYLHQIFTSAKDTFCLFACCCKGPTKTIWRGCSGASSRAARGMEGQFGHPFGDCLMAPA